jgi:DNA invertase Pin-like site-specific DNA recombinase
MKIGYCRVSTHDQSLNSQIDQLKDYGCEKIFHDVVSGVKSERSGLNSMFEVLREGDIVIIYKLDRLARGLLDLITIVEKFKSMKVGLKSVTENIIDTTTSIGIFMFQLMGVFAEFERNIIKERTKAGLESARRIGHKGGRPTKRTPEILKILKAMYDNKEISISTICKNLKISQSTFYNYLKESQSLASKVS